MPTHVSTTSTLDRDLDDLQADLDAQSARIRDAAVALLSLQRSKRAQEEEARAARRVENRALVRKALAAPVPELQASDSALDFLARIAEGQRRMVEKAEKGEG